jgi:hypothetical protein
MLKWKKEFLKEFGFFAKQRLPTTVLNSKRNFSALSSLCVALASLKRRSETALAVDDAMLRSPQRASE